ncbi:MAG: TPM domain-containing protein [Lachnospiraceae bacterium]|nr:TPM domain-containing protein [Lachnospiraceae bacterium]
MKHQTGLQNKKVARAAAGLAAALLIALTVCARFALPVKAAPPLLVDEADVLTDAQEAELNALLTEVSNAHNADVFVLIAQDLGGKESQAYADDYFWYNGYGRGASRSGALFLHCPSGRDYAFSTHGDAALAISDDALDDLENAVVDCLRADDFAGAYETFATGCDNYLQYMATYGVSLAKEDVENHPEDAQYMFDPPAAKLSFGERLLESMKNSAVFSPIAAAIGALLYGSSKKRKLVSVRKQSGAGRYVRSSASELRVSRDILVNRTQSRTPIHNNDDDRSGGRTGGSTSFHTSSSGQSFGGRSGKY